MVLTEKYGADISILLRILTAWRVNKESVDFKWGYFAPRLGFELVLHRGCYFDQHYAISFCFIWGTFHVNLPFKTKLSEGCDPPRYGFAIHNNTFWIYTGGEYDEQIGQCTKNDQYISWDLPFFSYDFDGHWIISKSGSYVLMRKGIDSWEFREKDAHLENHPYKYTLKNGTTQERAATISQEKRQWHRKWFPFLKMERVSIDIIFNDEVGERAGSWKGGVTGCGHDMLPHETMLDTLRRMEKERAFK